MKERNKPIGTCPCPIKGCDLSSLVFKYRGAQDGRRRFAGRLYLNCDAHGKYDGQEYILDNATIEGESWQPRPKEQSETLESGTSGDQSSPVQEAKAAPVQPHQSAPVKKPFFQRFPTVID